MTLTPLLALPDPGGSLAVEALVLAVLILLSAFFSGAEVALVGLSKLRRRKLRDANLRGAKQVTRLLEDPNAFLITILIGNNLVNIGAAALATSVAIRLFGSEGVGVATGVMTLLILTFGEVTPKAYATQHRERVSLLAAPVILGLQRILWPIVWAYKHLTDWLFRVFGTPLPPGDAAFRDEDELKTLIALGTEEGILEEEEQEMIHSVLDLGDSVAREIMVPRTDVVAVSRETPVRDARTVCMESGYSRIPVHAGSLDDVVGVLYIKDLLRVLVAGDEDRPVGEVMKEPFFVPETRRLDDLLRDMQSRRVHLGIVVDEFGGTAGIVTLEDLLEEIVGEIFDEYDPRREPIVRIDADTSLVDARVHVEELNHELGTDLPTTEHYDTVAGLIVHELGRLGREGEVLRLDGVDLVVEKVSNRRILRVRIRRRHPETTATGA